MPAHLIIQRGHSGPRLLQTFETLEEAETARDELIAENQDLSSTFYVLVTNTGRRAQERSSTTGR